MMPSDRFEDSRVCSSTSKSTKTSVHSLTQVERKSNEATGKAIRKQLRDKELGRLMFRDRSGR